MMRIGHDPASNKYHYSTSSRSAVMSPPRSIRRTRKRASKTPVVSAQAVIACIIVMLCCYLCFVVGSQRASMKAYDAGYQQGYSDAIVKAVTD